jgi:hypothetical protein
MHLRRPSPATAIAMLALFFALGGTAIAAHHYLITSTSQIKPSVLKALHGKQGPPGEAGANGAPGPQGPAGPGGPAGPSNLAGITEVKGPEEKIPVGKKVGGSIAVCPPGSHVVGGGLTDIAVPTYLVGEQASSDRTAWFAFVGSEAENGTVQAIAYCVTAGSAVAARRTNHLAELHALEAKNEVRLRSR